MPKPERALCGEPYHIIRSCKECHRLYMRRLRANRKTPPRQYGFKGPECLECGGIRSKVAESGYTDDGQRIRRRECLDCGQNCASVEVYIDPTETSFWRLNGARARRKREGAYNRKGKGIYRLEHRWSEPDEIEVAVAVKRGGRGEATRCLHGHLLTENNIYRGPNGKYRECVTCRKRRSRRGARAPERAA